MTGLLSATPSIVVAGSLEDIFDSKTRLWLVSVWLVLANMSLVVGPIFAAYVVSLIGWYGLQRLEYTMDANKIFQAMVIPYNFNRWCAIVLSCLGYVGKPRNVYFKSTIESH